MSRTVTIASAMTEAALEEHVRALCKDLDILRVHVYDSRRTTRGFPDDILIGSRIIYRELKTERGKITVEQEAVGQRIIKAGGDWDIWKPSDLLSGRIARELTAISRIGSAV